MQMALAATVPWPLRLPAGLMCQPLPTVLRGHHPSRALPCRTRAAVSAAAAQLEELRLPCGACNPRKATQRQLTVQQPRHPVERFLIAGKKVTAAGCYSPSSSSSTPLGGWTRLTCRPRCKGLQLELLAAVRCTHCCLHSLLPSGRLRLLMTMMLRLLSAQLCAAASLIQLPLQLRKCRSRLRLILLLNQRVLASRRALTLLVSGWALQLA